MLDSNNKPLSRRQEALTLIKTLCKISSNSPELQVLLRLLALLAEEAMEKLLIANPQSFPALQAEAVVYRDLIRKLTVMPQELPKE